jgi:16S rRNA C1402 N4-methylase RsmH
MGICDWGLIAPTLMADNSLHTPVMLERSVELLAPALSADGAVLVDATLGLGGHAEAFLTRFPNIVLVGLDRDPEALRLTGERLKPFGDRVHLVHAVYDTIADVLQSLGMPTAAGILFDLGVSSLQLDRVDRGFSYSQDAPLDMRMDSTSPLTAERILAQELSVLSRAIPAAVDVLAVDGRMVVLAYQSLEDRIVKRAFAARSVSTAPAGLPIELPEHRPELRLLVRGAELASDSEKLANPRATPVRLRAVQRLRSVA